MSIVKLLHINIIAPVSDHHALTERLHEFGQLHIEGISRFKAEKSGPLLEALTFLMRSKIILHQELIDPKENQEQLIDKILHIRDLIQQYKDKKEFLEERIKDVTPWGNIEYEDLAKIPNYRFWYYQVPHYMMHNVRSSSLNWTIVNKDLRFAYVVIVSKDEPRDDQMPVSRTHMGSISLAELKDEKQKTERLIEQYNLERQELTIWIQWLLNNRSADINEQHLKQAQEVVNLEQGLCRISGWLPKDDISNLIKLCQCHQWALSYKSPAKGEAVPTLMKNPMPLSAGEDLTHFYQTPSYDSWDPSIILFFSFSTFFSMILADAGYAFILFIILVFFRKHFSKTTTLKRLGILLLTMIGFSIVYGILCGSYFGITPSMGPLDSLAIIDLNNYDLMIDLSLAIGILHILLANGITCWRHGLSTQTGRLFAGWFLLTMSLSSLYFFPYENMLTLFSTCAFASACIIIWNGSEEHENPPPLKRLCIGLITLTDITKLFGDILSYLRLFALGLASAALAVTFNDLGKSASDSIPFWGHFIALFIWLFGHGLNFILGVMSGVVHGLRLNFIEFYHWSLSDEGYPFHAFKKHEVKPWKPYS